MCLLPPHSKSRPSKPKTIASHTSKARIRRTPSGNITQTHTQYQRHVSRLPPNLSPKILYPRSKSISASNFFQDEISIPAWNFDPKPISLGLDMGTGKADLQQPQKTSGNGKDQEAAADLWEKERERRNELVFREIEFTNLLKEKLSPASVPAAAAAEKREKMKEIDEMEMRLNGELGKIRGFIEERDRREEITKLVNKARGEGLKQGEERLRKELLPFAIKSPSASLRTGEDLVMEGNIGPEQVTQAVLKELEISGRIPRTIPLSQPHPHYPVNHNSFYDTREIHEYGYEYAHHQPAQGRRGFSSNGIEKNREAFSWGSPLGIGVEDIKERVERLESKQKEIEWEKIWAREVERHERERRERREWRDREMLFERFAMKSEY